MSSALPNSEVAVSAEASAFRVQVLNAIQTGRIPSAFGLIRFNRLLFAAPAA
jgi:hypothetical protein